jgi:hypothetical protein
MKETVARRNPAIHDAITHKLNPHFWVRPECGGLLNTLWDLSPVFGGQSIRLRLALVKLAADVGEVGRKLLPHEPLAEDRLRIPKNCRIIMDCAEKKPRESLLSVLQRRRDATSALQACEGVPLLAPPVYLVQKIRVPDGCSEVRVGKSDRVRPCCCCCCCCRCRCTCSR